MTACAPDGLIYPAIWILGILMGLLIAWFWRWMDRQ